MPESYNLKCIRTPEVSYLACVLTALAANNAQDSW
jgi:hypothetical protein